VRRTHLVHRVAEADAGSGIGKADRRRRRDGRRYADSDERVSGAVSAKPRPHRRDRAEQASGP